MMWVGRFLVPPTTHGNTLFQITEACSKNREVNSAKGYYWNSDKSLELVM
jgi:hypothetical protein